jgi:hypothetical protein
MTNPASWPSLADQLSVAESLFGFGGQQRVAAWLDEQEGLVDNADFARSFADHIDLPGVGLLDYAHRYVRSSGEAALGGIRFYNRNIEPPFVEIIVHSFSDIDALRDCVRVEWSAFSPLFIRLRTRPGRLAAAGARVHKSIYVGRYRDLQPSDGCVSLGGLGHLRHELRLGKSVPDCRPPPGLPTLISSGLARGQVRRGVIEQSAA